MSLSPDQVRQIITQDINPGVRKRFLDALVDANRTAKELIDSGRIGRCQTRDVFGTIQRAVFETRIEKQKDFGPGIEANCRQTNGGTASYVEICGPRVVMTESLVRGKHLPRNAFHRQERAVSSQIWLPGVDGDPEFDVSSSRIYVIFRHAYDKEYNLCSADLVVPDANAKNVLAKLSLEGELNAALSNSVTSTPLALVLTDEPLNVEVVPAPLPAGLRLRAKREGGAG